MSEKVQLEKSLSPAGVWAMAVGSIIGWGCFILPSDMLGKAGPVGAALGIFIGGIIMYVIARSYGLMVREFPVAGGAFTYAYKGFGRTHAYLCGWFLTLGYLSIVPLNATALAIMGKFVLPDLFKQGYLYTIAGFDVALPEIILASVVIVTFAYLNIRGVKEVGKLQVVMVGLLCGAVFLIGGGTLLSGNTDISNLTPLFHPEKTSISAIISILVIAPWLFVGFDSIPQSAEEYDFSPSQAAFLIVAALFAGGLMYIVVLLSTALVFPWQETVANNYTWATGTVTQVCLGNFGVGFLITAVTMGILTGINGFYMATSRLLLSMSRAKILPQWFGRLHPKFNTPANAIMFTAGISLLAPWFGRQVIVWVVDMAALGSTFGYVYTCFTAYLICKTSPKIAPKEASLGKVFGILGGLLSICFVGLLVVPGSPGVMSMPSVVALGVWVAIGVIFYMTRAKEYNALTKGELDRLIFGDLVDGASHDPKAQTIGKAGELVK